jgi:hypothetical protein
VDQGFKRQDSAVTVVTVTGPTDILDLAEEMRCAFLHRHLPSRRVLV